LQQFKLFIDSGTSAVIDIKSLEFQSAVSLTLEWMQQSFLSILLVDVSVSKEGTAG
jgi:hypothetical protein